MPSRRRQEDRSAATRSAIMASARRLFSEQGYAATGLDEVVRAAGVTRGALYHHFQSKAAVFTAVVEQIDEELLRDVLARAHGTVGAANWIRALARAYVEVGARSAGSRIAADVASVLGPEAYRQISAARCRPMAYLAGEVATESGIPLPGDPNVLAAMLLGALNEGVSLLAPRPDDETVRGPILATIDALFDRILA